MNKRKLLLIVLIIICFMSLSFSIYKIYMWKVNNEENEEIQDDLDQLINDDIMETDDENKIDFAALKEKNPDTIAYLKVNNTKIDYVVVKGKDNSYYLTHDFNKKSNSAGWVFADYHNKYDGTDKNKVIYGHNRLNGSMFGSLKKTLEKKWFNNKDNHKILLADETGEHYYQVFSNYMIKVENYYINTEFKNDDEFYKFIKTLKKRSKYNYKVDLSKDDQILTLSTCTSGGKKRVVMHAKLIKE